MVAKEISKTWKEWKKWTPCSKLDDLNFVDDSGLSLHARSKAGKTITMTGTSAQIELNTNIAKADIFRTNTLSNVTLYFKRN